MTTQTLVGEHSELEVQPARNREEFARLAHEAGIVSISLPPEADSCSVPKGETNWRPYSITDVRLKPCRVSSKKVLSMKQVAREAELVERVPLTLLETVAFAASREFRQMRLPKKCKGILILGSGFGKQAPVLRRRNDGRWILQGVPASSTDGFCFLTRRLG